MISEVALRQRHHVLQNLSRYWPEGSAAIEALPMRALEPCCAATSDFTLVSLPDWADDVATDGGLLVPSSRIVPGAGEAWERTDWLGAAFDLLECMHEREYERSHGPIHSYSFRLPGCDVRLWRRAWVNRIALFLRRWVAYVGESDEERLFGPRPAAEILLTHDVDAVAKTGAIRLKQGAFAAFNAARNLAHGQWRASGANFATGTRFLFGPGNYDYLAEVAKLEGERRLSAAFHVYAGRRRGPKSWLFDPSYDVAHPALRTQIIQLAESGHRVGLHPSFDSWNDFERIEEERARLESATDLKIVSCRQHWLRFSWARTWEEQRKAGLSLDTTLGFNDRPGFRNASALRWRPWSEAKQVAGEMEAVPLLFMDSHFYDYLCYDDAERRRVMSYWLEEVRAVGGVASVLWHPHTLDPDYGWHQGFVELLDALEGFQ
jgi:hypothetical protein